MLKPTLLAAVLFAVASGAHAQPATSGYPKLIPAPGGEVVIHSPGGQRNYDEYKFAPGRRG